MVLWKTGLGLLFLAAFLLLIGWGIWPLQYSARELEVVLPESMYARGFAQPATIILHWPERIRLNDVERLELSLQTQAIELPAESGDQANVAGSANGNGSFSNIVAEARLEVRPEAHPKAGGMEYSPVAEVLETLKPGETASFFWSIRAARAGQASATVWLHFQSIPQDSAQPSARAVLSAQRVETRVVDLLGLSGPAARWLGVVCGILAGWLILATPMLQVWNKIGPQATFFDERNDSNLEERRDGI